MRQFGEGAAQRRGSPLKISTQERLLESELKLAHWTEGVHEEPLQMFDRLQQRIGLRTLGRRPASAQGRAHLIQALAQPVQQMINRLQSQRLTQRRDHGLDAGLAQPLDQQLPQPRGGEAMARQDVGQKNGKGASAAAALAAVGTKDPLTSDGLSVGLVGIVAVKEAVPV